MKNKLEKLIGLVLVVAGLCFLLIGEQNAFAQTSSDLNQANTSKELAPNNETYNATAEELENRGKELNKALREAGANWHPTKKEGGSAARLDISALVEKYIPAGSSFKDSATVLNAADLDLQPLPPRPPRPDDPHYDRFSIFGEYRDPDRNRNYGISVWPAIAGDTATTVKKVTAIISLENLW